MKPQASIVGARIYARVSDDRSGFARSVDEQQADNRAVCERHGWQILGEYSDNDIGASKWTKKKVRPEYERLKEDIRPGEVIVFWEASRNTRDMPVYYALEDLCADLGVMWCFSGRLLDPRDPDDQFMGGFEALLAKRETDLTRKRVLRTMKQNVADGKPHGKPPFGYDAIRDRMGRLEGWEINPKQAALIREAADRITENSEGVMGIARDFNERGIPTPGGAAAAGTRKQNGKVAQGWSNTTLRRLLMNPQIAGLRVHEKQAVGQGTWEGIITEGQHYRLVAILGDSGRLLHRGTDPKNLLAGIGRCGGCSALLVRNTSGGKQYYGCPDCGLFTRPVHYIDPMVEEAVILWLERFDVAQYAAKSDPAAKADVTELEELRARLADFEGKAVEGTVSADAFGRIEAKLSAQIVEVEKRLRHAHAPVPGLSEVAGPDARKAWGALDMKRKRQIVAGVVTVLCDPLPDELRLRRRFLPEYVRYTDWLT
ncbi:recombinase family protein [Nocardia sp. NPDC051832]|uniref:recombinase family protein n=1 Tax=Nocardia sp. NPDC051832 TaxID=3155673 RepID=UPI00342D4761